MRASYMTRHNLHNLTEDRLPQHTTLLLLALHSMHGWASAPAAMKVTITTVSKKTLIMAVA